ncbi:MAG TPA: LEA type 2 family protein [Trueperaceae bacterium]
MKPRITGLAPCILLLLALSACAPGANLIQSPTFRFVPEGSGLVRLEPLGIGSGQAVFRINLEVTNPNPVGLQLAGLDFDLALGGHRIASSRFDGGLSLAAQGTSKLSLEVAVPLAHSLQLSQDLTRLVAGEPTQYTLTGTVTVDIFGMHQQLPTAVLASGTIRQPLRLVAPHIRFLPDASGVRELGFNRAVVEVALEVENPSPLGYVFRAPSLALSLGGVRVARADTVSAPIAPVSSQQLALRFEFRPAALGTALYGQLAALSVGGSLSLTVAGDFALEIPGITSRSFPASQLVSGVLR